MMDGGTVTSLTGIAVCGGVDPGRRIRELRSMGYPVSARIVRARNVEGAKIRYNEWFIAREDVMHSRELLAKVGSKLIKKNSGGIFKKIREFFSC